ncbi:unnamed protein product [marine sediment metagenome]|uniref:Uncharacterized protein n=1 Tax=marine sediment metagenome TaxID=412755 RepID=X1JLC0_9ZZZZ
MEGKLQCPCFLRRWGRRRCRSWWEVCEENGIERIELSAAEQEKWREAAKPTWDKWVAEREAEGVPGQEIIDETLRLFEKYCEG